MSAEQTILVCKPLDLPGYVVSGSIISECAECGKPIFVAPSGQALMKETPDCWAVCLLCGVKLMKEHPVLVEPPTLAQQQEISDGRRAEYYNRRN